MIGGSTACNAPSHFHDGCFTIVKCSSLRLLKFPVQELEKPCVTSPPPLLHLTIKTCCRAHSLRPITAINLVEGKAIDMTLPKINLESKKFWDARASCHNAQIYRPCFKLQHSRNTQTKVIPLKNSTNCHASNVNSLFI